MLGFEIEGVDSPGEAIREVVVGQILEMAPHPNADKLTLCKVTDGAETHDIVCGANNMQANDFVALARVGTVLPGDFKIVQRKIRGEVSRGMLCSTRELGLGDEHKGILILPTDSKIGTRLVDEMGLSDAVFDINITPNRPDTLCAVGIARELAAAYGGAVKMPATDPIEPGCEPDMIPSVTLEAGDLCPRYTALVIKGVKIAPSPAWLKNRLEACGIRSVNNIVDISNLVLMELGQPLHTFDYDKLNKNRIIVRRAKPNEKIVTLDGDTRELTEDTLVIADAKEAVAVAGVMGGIDSEVSDTTTNILIESAFFHPPSIRRTSKRLGLPSEASYRFERGVDLETTIPASWRCAQLILELAGGAVAGQLCVADTEDEAHLQSLKEKTLSFRLSFCHRLLGKTLTAEEIEKILKSLNLTVQERDGDRLTLKIPSYRQDITREADIVEEIARCHGYGKFESTLPNAPIKNPEPQIIDRALIARLKQYLSESGLDETVTYTFTDTESIQPFTPVGISLNEDITTIQNPLHANETIMRTALVPSLLIAARKNAAHGNTDFGLFELSRIFLPNKDELEEKMMIAAVVIGNPHQQWRDTKAELDFFDIKGLAEGLLRHCSISRYRLIDAPNWLHPKRGASVMAGKKPSGSFGELHPKLAEQYELPGRVLTFEFDLKALSDTYRATTLSYRPFSVFPSIKRDLALLVPERINSKQVEEIIRKESGILLEDLTIFDYYRGKQVTKDYVSLGYRMVYRSSEETLKEETVDAICEQILPRLQKELGVQLRS